MKEKFKLSLIFDKKLTFYRGGGKFCADFCIWICSLGSPHFLPHIPCKFQVHIPDFFQAIELYGGFHVSFLNGQWKCRFVSFSKEFQIDSWVFAWSPFQAAMVQLNFCCQLMECYLLSVAVLAGDSYVYYC